jgi:hypothetical protein
MAAVFPSGPDTADETTDAARCGNSADCLVSYVTCDSTNAAVRIEATLLGQYLSEHGELPPESRVLPRDGIPKGETLT